MALLILPLFAPLSIRYEGHLVKPGANVARLQVEHWLLKTVSCSLFSFSSSFILHPSSFILCYTTRRPETHTSFDHAWSAGSPVRGVK
jgi:hypothetical protein